MINVQSKNVQMQQGGQGYTNMLLLGMYYMNGHIFLFIYIKVFKSSEGV